MKIKANRRGETLQALEAALARLVNGNPNNVRPGYRISVNAVCREAGVSRQALYSRYRSFQDVIVAAAAKIGRPTVSRSRRREMDVRTENDALKARITALLSENATLLHRAVTAEKMLQAVPGKARLSALPSAFAGRTRPVNQNPE